VEKSRIIAYQSTVEEVLKRLEVGIEGLSGDQVKMRLLRYGYNQLTGKKSVHPFVIFINQFSNPLVLLLVVSAVISFFLQEFIDAGFITAIVFINAAIGFLQEYKAENTINALKKLLSPKSLVVRDKRQIEVEARELVPGDIVHITAGNAVPADMRLMDEQNLRIDESTLTGESVPVSKNARVINGEAQVADQKNMAFMGTTVVGGTAVGVVVATGNFTFLGSIARQTSSAAQEQSPLTEKFAGFARVIGIITVIASVMIAVAQIGSGQSLVEVFKIVVGIAVATIPEGLPIIVTIALSLAVQRMGRQNAIIRHLPAAETLGSTTVICTDKTGTLTQNKMSVMKIFDGKSEHEAHVKYDHGNKHLSNLLLCGMLCTEDPEVHSNPSLADHGDPTEMAVVVASQRSGISSRELESWKYTDILPFQIEKRLMAVMVEKGREKVLFVKGSPEKILALSHQQDNKELLAKVDEFAKNGLRVVACAEKKLHTGNTISNEHLHSGFTFLGFFALMDPPRPDVKEAISLCRQSGIRVVMITGDHPVTASAIARDLGIAENFTAITGQELLHMPDADLRESLKNSAVFARVTPDQKLRIVNAFKAVGEIVAVTGDGVNDAPALKTAHIGVAMGGKGTDVAKEAADMVILDDSFTTIVQAVREARTLFENIRKATFFLVPCGFSVILTIGTSLLLGYPMPYTAIQLLWVNIVTNGLQDVSLAFEPEEKSTLLKPPRKPTEGIMSGMLYRRSILVAVVITIGVVTLYARALDSGRSLMEAQTVALSTMIVFQFFQLFNSRSETTSIFKQNFFSNKLLIVSMILAVIAYVLSITFAPLQLLLETTIISPRTLIEIILMAFTVIVVIEIDKAFTVRFKRGFSGANRFSKSVN
jgi:Ca2+-transporting ATPase